jgi:hypothetical protein
MEFRITGRIIPYVRMTQRSKHVDPDAIAYLASQDAIRWQLKQQMIDHGWEMLPESTPLLMRLHFDIGHAMHKYDRGNIEKAVEDAAQGIVFKNDAWIDDSWTVREQIDNLPEDITTLMVTVL